MNNLDIEALKMSYGKSIEKLQKKIIKLETFAIFITQAISSVIGADQAKEFIAFIKDKEKL